MKKKSKIILFISILLIIFIIILITLSQLENYTLVVDSIENDNVIAKRCIIVDTNNNPLEYKYYSFLLKDVLLKDTMNVEKLKEGDTIYLLTMKELNKPDIGYSITPLSNVILLKLLDN